MNVTGIILAGGKGTRMNSHRVNKVTLAFAGKPIIVYAVELLQGIAEPTVVVVGSYADSVKAVLKNYKVVYKYQKKRLGTAHATKVGLDALKHSPQSVVVGYGDHMMFYAKDAVKKLIRLQQEEKAAISLITTFYNRPNELVWGRIVRDKRGCIVDNIEQRDANKAQARIKELNAGFYCFDYEFLSSNIDRVPKSTVSGEYYINSLIKIAVSQGKKVVGLRIPFHEVGIGINRLQELDLSQSLFLQKRKNS